jgi:type III pantothenate kinase
MSMARSSSSMPVDARFFCPGTCGESDVLVVDIGNSRIKAAWQHGDELQALAPVATAQAEFTCWDGQAMAAPRRILVASVAADEITENLRAYCRERWQRELECVVPQQQLAGMTTRYREPRQLGVDRWLAALAAYDAERGPVCVIDVGTALTVDVVTAAGTHIGGLIAPGPALMRASLSTATARLTSPRFACVDEFADHTVAAIALGISDAVAGLIERVAARLARHASARAWRWFATGGGYADIAPLLPRDAIHVPDLVLRGLVVYARAT